MSMGTSKPTIAAIRERTHWNSANLTPSDPVTLGLCGRGAGICQETCELIVNGETHEAVPIDVKEMYRQKILGK